MITKSISGKKGVAYYRLDSQGNVYLDSIVTQGNFVERYNSKYFSSEKDLMQWLNA